MDPRARQRAGALPRDTVGLLVIPAPYANFLVASAQASAALIGLLFVSASIAPERVFGLQAEAGRLATALSSFTALANVFSISFSSLIPNQPIGAAVVILGACWPAARH